MGKIVLLFVVLLVLLFIFACMYQYLYAKIFPQQTAPSIPPGPTNEQLMWIEMGSYMRFAAVMIDCVENNYNACALAHPGSEAQHMAEENGVIFYKGCLLFRYCFDRSSILAPFGDRSQPRYSVMDAKDMSRKLNQVLGNYCRTHGFVPVKIVHQYDLPGGRVCFVVGPFPWPTDALY